VAAVVSHLLVTNDFPPKTGGIQVYLHELWRRLEPDRAVVLTATSHPDARTFDAASDVTVERVPTRTLFWPSRRTRRVIEDAIARHDPALIILDPAWPLGLVGRHLSRPYAVVLHGAEVTIPGRLPILRRSLRRVLAGATVAVCAGGYPEAEARRNAGCDMPPVVQISPGVDTNRFTPLSDVQRGDTRRRLGLLVSGPLIVSYSRLVPRKGMDTLIRASVKLAGQFPGFRVAIGGSGRDRRRLERLARQVSAPVTFLGRVGDDDLPDFVGAADLMVMDCRSRWAGFEQEGFGIVFAEAAASGVAQVAGRSGGSHEAVIDGVTGTVVHDSASVDALVDAIASLLRDDERRERLGHNARRHALDELDWARLARRLGDGLRQYDQYAK